MAKGISVTSIRAIASTSSLDGSRIPHPPPGGNGKGACGAAGKNRHRHGRCRFSCGRGQKVTVRLGSVKEEKVAVTSVRAKIMVLPSPGAYMARRLG